MSEVRLAARCRYMGRGGTVFTSALMIPSLRGAKDEVLGRNRY